jgi:extracellular elastinolytic metalloproteinase
MQANFKYLQILPFILCILCIGVSPNIYSQNSAKELKALIFKNLNAIGLTKEEADNCIINSNYKDAGSGVEYVYIQQTYKNIKVFNIVISLAFKNNNLLYASGKFLNSSSSFIGTEIPTIEAVTAVSNAARHLKLRPVSALTTTKNNFKVDKKIMFSGAGIAKREIESELLWAQDDTGKVHLTWNVSIDVENSNDWWNVRVDALTGEIVNKDNWTVHEKLFQSEETQTEDLDHKNQIITRGSPAKISTLKTKNFSGEFSPFFLPPNVQNAAYRVVPYPFESKNFGTVTIDNDPWLKAGATNNATTYGWHFDGTTNYSITRGNNVYAYEDSSNTNNPGRVVTSSTQPPFVNFDVLPNFSTQPFDSTNRNFGIVNLFYWNNIIHDVFYQYGFTENAGNFQADNIGRGSTGNDYIRAEAQDGAGTDNANFSTPPDGSSGRMQMYLWSGIPDVIITAPASIAMKYAARESGLSLNNKLYKIGPVSGQVVFYNDASSGGATHEACDSSMAPLNSVAGKIAYITRGPCAFTIKMRSAQKAGAIGVIIANNVPGPPIVLGGTDNAITIPGVMVSQDDGAKIAAEIPNNVFINLVGGLLADGDIDNGIVTHEYGHGISNRLTGGRLNASCLNNAEQGGEGWSDYLALMVTTDWQNTQITDGSKLRPVGTYALGQPSTGRGIRRVPYTTDILIDTLTYKSMDASAAGSEVHNIGEIWCSAIWDMTWNIIRHEGNITSDLYNSTGPGGNIIALKLVMEGMKLQPCRPGFLDARNAILAADSILYNNSHKCDIWNAFAKRGMGYSAVQGSSGSTGDQVPAFDVPSGIVISRSAAPSIVNTDAEVLFNTTVSCQCNVPGGTFSITDTIPSGFTYVRSSNGTLHDNVVQFNPVSFSNSLETITLSLTLKATSAGCAITKPINDDRETNQVGGFIAERITGTTTNWVSSTNHFFSSSNAWYAANPSAANNITLTSGAFTPGNLSILSFWHYFVTEIYLDGGKVEISSNNGSTWIDASSYFLQNGYNGLLNANAPQPNTYAFTGSSYATGSNNNGQFILSVIDLSSFANQSIKVRFRYQTNANNAGAQTYDGWYIDDIALTNGCGGINQLAVFDASANKIDSVSRPFFIVANSVLPLTLINFSAKQMGREVLLNWETSAELNTKNFEVERSSDGINWTKIGTVSAKELNKNSYIYNDQLPLEHNNFYRIKVNDKNGVYTYTIIKKIELGAMDILTLVPNPAIDKTTVYFGFNAKGGVLMVTDLEGRVLQRHLINDNTGSYVIPTGNLPSGNYMIRMQSKIGGVTTIKLIVAH